MIETPKYLLSIDPGIKSGYALFRCDEARRVYQLVLYGVCTPANTATVQDCVCAMVEYCHGNLEAVIEDQRHGSMGTRTFITLVRGRERWQCLLEALGIRVAEIVPATWQSWAYNRKRPDNAKKASVERVNLLYNLVLEGLLLENTADAINLGECHLNGNVLYENVAEIRMFSPTFLVKVEVQSKKRDGTVQTRTIDSFIQRATKTKLFLVNSEIAFPRKTGRVRKGPYTYLILKSSLKAFEEAANFADSWPA